MAGNKKVPLTLGVGGKVIGTASIDENGLIMGEVEDPEVANKLFSNNNLSLSIWEPKE